MAAGAPKRLDRGTVLALVAMALAVFVVANDVTAMSVSLPSIEGEFDADVSSVQWVLNAYAVVFGVLLVSGGRLADLFGRRRLFFIGAGVFATFSLLGALAPGVWWLVAARALMGVGAALMWPAVLGMVFTILPEDRAGLAGGLVLGAAGFGNAAGPLIGGTLTEVFDWRAILVLNLPVAAIASLATWRNVTESRADASERHLDYAGVATLSVGVIALLIALDEVTDLGLGDPRIIGLFVLFVGGLAAFSRVERGAGAKALIPRDVINNRPFAIACLITLLTSPVLFSSLMYLPQFMQKILGYSAIEAGLGMLPMMVVFAATSFAAGNLYERYGARAILLAGTGALALGPLLISIVERGSGYVALVPGMIVAGLGCGLFYSAITTVAVTALDSARASLAGGIIYMFQIAGGSIGLGLTTAVFSTASSDRLTSDPGIGAVLSSSQQDAVGGILSGADSGTQLQHAFPAAAARLEELARQSFTSGLQWGFRFLFVFALLGFLVTLFGVGRKAESEQPVNAAATQPA